MSPGKEAGLLASLPTVINRVRERLEALPTEWLQDLAKSQSNWKTYNSRVLITLALPLDML